MAEIIDREEEHTLDKEALEVGLREKEENPVDDLPEKFKGKSAKEIAEAYLNLEKEHGRKAQEIGELRKLADDFLKSQITKPTPVKEEEVTDVDFFENPKEAVRRAVDSHPRIKEAEEKLANVSRMEAQAALKSTHPDYPQIVADLEFQQWVQKSKVRTELLIRADRAFDADAAIELFDTWKELTKVKKTQEIVSQAEDKRKESLSKAATTSGTAVESSRKIFRRVDLIRLKQTDPERYYSLSDEIIKAYQEGRVK